MTKLVTITEGDTLRVQVTVVDQATGDALNITGATLVTKAKSGSTQVTGLATILDGPAGEARLDYTAGALTRGRWRLQCSIGLASEVQTAVELDVQVNATVLA